MLRVMRTMGAGVSDGFCGLLRSREYGEALVFNSNHVVPLRESGMQGNIGEAALFALCAPCIPHWPDAERCTDWRQCNEREMPHTFACAPWVDTQCAQSNLSELVRFVLFELGGHVYLEAERRPLRSAIVNGRSDVARELIRAVPSMLRHMCPLEAFAQKQQWFASDMALLDTLLDPAGPAFPWLAHLDEDLDPKWASMSWNRRRTIAKHHYQTARKALLLDPNFFPLQRVPKVILYILLSFLD
jgi:hypothetical protein